MSLSSIINAETAYDRLLTQRGSMQAPTAEILLAGASWSSEVWEEAVRLGAIQLAEGQITQGLRLAQSPVFICGVHRSGTTLVRDMLDSHPQLVVLPSEGTYYTNLERKLLMLPEKERAAFMGMEWLRRFANPINQAPYWLLGRSLEKTSVYVDFARYILAWWGISGLSPQTAVILAYAACTNNSDAKYWVDKTPTNERFLLRIWTETPNAKIIHVVRDPLATLNSRKKMEPLIKFRHALADLERSFKIAAKYQDEHNENYLLIRYESLCNDPQAITHQIADFLDIDMDDILSRPTVCGMDAQVNSSFNKSASSGQILTASQHQQTQILSMNEQLEMAAYLDGIAVKLGYKLPKVGLLRRLLILLKYKLLRR